MLNFHHHHLVILIAVDVCLGEWYPGLNKADVKILQSKLLLVFCSKVALVVGFLLGYFPFFLFLFPATLFALLFGSH